MPYVLARGAMCVVVVLAFCLAWVVIRCLLSAQKTCQIGCLRNSFVVSLCVIE